MPSKVEPQRHRPVLLPLVDEHHRSGAGRVGPKELVGERAGTPLDDDDRALRHTGVVRILAAAGARVGWDYRRQGQIDRPNRRRDVKAVRRGFVHRAEVAAKCRPSDPADELGATLDTQRGSLKVSEEVQVVLELRHVDVEPGSCGALGDVVGGTVVTRCAGQAIPRFRIGDRLQGPLVLEDPGHGYGLTELRRVVVVRVCGGRYGPSEQDGARQARATNRPCPPHRPPPAPTRVPRLRPQHRVLLVDPSRDRCGDGCCPSGGHSRSGPGRSDRC